MALDRNFVSDMDKFLNSLKSNPPSPAQTEEQAKYEQIYKLRDETDQKGWFFVKSFFK